MTSEPIFIAHLPLSWDVTLIQSSSAVSKGAPYVQSALVYMHSQRVVCPVGVCTRFAALEASAVVQLHGGSNEHTAAANHGVGAHAAHRDPMADGNHHGQAGGDQSQTHEGGSKHELLTTHEIADLDHAKEDGYHTEQAVKENVEVSKIDIEGTEALGAEKATERAERPERQAVRENVMRGMQMSLHACCSNTCSRPTAPSGLSEACLSLHQTRLVRCCCLIPCVKLASCINISGNCIVRLYKEHGYVRQASFCVVHI